MAVCGGTDAWRSSAPGTSAPAAARQSVLLTTMAAAGPSGPASFTRQTSREPFAVRCRSLGRNCTVAPPWKSSPSSRTSSPRRQAASSLCASSGGYSCNCELRGSTESHTTHWPRGGGKAVGTTPGVQAPPSGVDSAAATRRPAPPPARTTAPGGTESCRTSASGAATSPAARQSVPQATASLTTPPGRGSPSLRTSLEPFWVRCTSLGRSSTKAPERAPPNSTQLSPRHQASSKAPATSPVYGRSCELRGSTETHTAHGSSGAAAAVLPSWLGLVPALAKAISSSSSPCSTPVSEWRVDGLAYPRMSTTASARLPSGMSLTKSLCKTSNCTTASNEGTSNTKGAASHRGSRQSSMTSVCLVLPSTVTRT
mmetsp:Transcript_7478/g.23238  ORF Transcript_7478/g.23238 Transcript_7478/m.23238 type:complete len:370 (-) Transcript_7478:1351-2460(-)